MHPFWIAVLVVAFLLVVAYALFAPDPAPRALGGPNAGLGTGATTGSRAAAGAAPPRGAGAPSTGAAAAAAAAGASSSSHASGAGASASAAASSPAKPSGPVSDRFRIKEERMALLREQSRERYLRLHPDFVPPKDPKASEPETGKPHQA